MATQRRLVVSWGNLILFLTAVMLSLGNAGRVSAEDEEIVVLEPVGSDSPVVEGTLGAPEGIAAYALDEAQASPAGEEPDQDPWEGFNEPMFRFNRQVDRFFLKPIATGWDFVLPDFFQRSLKNALDNLAVVRRLVNNLLQAKWEGSAREVARFTINSTVGLGGLIDVAKDGLGIQQSDEDTGQTFGVWGIGAGPYLILPLLPPMTVRDGIGLAIDGAMQPLNYFIPFGATAGIYGTTLINERSLNLDKYERVEESVVDLYSAVRNAYLQRRAAAIKE